MTAMTPLEARCEHCHQVRPLFIYQPDHVSHLGGYGMSCRWCRRKRQPLLCVRCYDTEAVLEENDTALAEEDRVWARIVADNTAIDERREADREECEAIAEATARSNGGEA
jgi:hypothetical protein